MTPYFDLILLFSIIQKFDSFDNRCDACGSTENVSNVNRRQLLGQISRAQNWADDTGTSAQKPGCKNRAEEIDIVVDHQLKGISKLLTNIGLQWQVYLVFGIIILLFKAILHWKIKELTKIKPLKEHILKKKNLHMTFV